MRSTNRTYDVLDVKKIRMNENANKLIERIQTRTSAAQLLNAREMYIHTFVFCLLKILRGN